MRIIFTYLLFIFLVFGMEAQDGISIREASNKLTKKYKKAKDKWQKGEWEKALADFKKIIQSNPDIIEPYVQLSGIYYDQKMYSDAEYFLEKAIELDPDDKPANTFSLARLQHLQKKFQQAAENYETFLAQNPKSNNRIELARKHLRNAKFAALAVTQPVDFEPTRLEKQINSDNSEYLPAFSADGESLIFTRRINNQEDFFQSKMSEEGFETAVPVSFLNSPFNEGAHSLSPDGKQLFFTFCHRMATYGGCDIYFSELTDGKWSKPKNLGEIINGPSWDAQPSISADGRTLVFSSRRNTGKGGADLWISQKDSEGQWSKPVNLPGLVNSDGNEESPYLHPDGKTIYFRSDGHPGMGDYDIFYARWDAENKQWGKPVNLGYPINSEGSEGALFVSLDGTTAYYSSDAFSQSEVDVKANLDLYSFKLPESARPELVTYVKGMVINKSTGYEVSANLELIDFKNSSESLQLKTDQSGHFLICLPVGTNYSLTIEKTGYSFYSEHFSLDSISNALNPFLLNIELQPLPEPKLMTEKVETAPITLNNIFFESGSAKLKEESNFEIQNLFELLEASKKMKIRIVGHTDDVGTPDSNQYLSEQRAKAVYTELLNKGISSDRIEYKGMGENSPIADNTTAEGRQKNRRTEFVILSP